MRVFITAVFVVAFSMVFSQETHYQTIKATLKITATKNGKPFSWENKKLTVRIDYKTGNFIARLKSTDFDLTHGEESQIENTDSDNREYVFKGILPVSELVNQKNINQAQSVEMQLICDDLRLNETLQFQMLVTRPGAGNYRIFTLSGKLYNDDVNIPAFEGFDHEINLFFMFNAINSN